MSAQDGHSCLIIPELILVQELCLKAMMWEITTLYVFINSLGMFMYIIKCIELISCSWFEQPLCNWNVLLSL